MQENYLHACAHAHTQWIEPAMSIRGIQTLVSG